jgi:hypothetical protein
MTPPHLFIGIIGKKQSGKDTVGKILANWLYSEYTPIRIAFADGLKDEVCKLLDCDLKKLEENKKHPTVRNLLQYHGTEYCRKVNGDDYWIKQAALKINKTLIDFPKGNKPILFYFTDCRFLNEADYIKAEGGYLVKVERGGYDINDSHASEIEQDKIHADFHVNNNFGLGVLELEIRGSLVPKLRNAVNAKLTRKAA